MARTTDLLVSGICEVDSSHDVSPFIDIANELVSEKCVDSGYSDERLEKIERWLAAHFYCCEYPRASSETAGPVSTSYQQRVGLGLELTAYGQQVKLLDTAGNLAALDKASKEGGKRKGRVVWLGKDC